MNKMFDDNLSKKIFDSGVLAVLVIDDAGKAVKLANCLLENGINAIELALRTEAAIDALQAISENVPGMITGIGTVLRPDQIDTIIDKGAKFAFAPGMNPEVVRKAKEKSFSFVPGIVTPSDIECAIGLGCNVLKFFPAEPSGGIKYLKSMAAPYKHLNLKYIPLGGVNTENAKDYLECDMIGAIGGSWIASRDLIAEENWKQISQNAKEASAMAKEIRG